jgi:hypothetical protein
VRGCVDAPAGSTLQLLARPQAEAPGAFEPRIAQPAGDGAFELCLTNEGSDEALELRVEVRTPSGAIAATQASDVLSLFSNPAACVASEVLCCPAGAQVDAGMQALDAAMPMMPTQPGARRDAGSVGEVVDPQPSEGVSDAGPHPARPVAERATTSGCQASPAAGRHATGQAAALVVLGLRSGRRLRRAQRGQGA